MFVRVSFKNVPGAQKTFADKQNLKRQIAESSACNIFGDLPPLLHRPGYGLVSLPRGGSRIFGDYNTNLLVLGPRPSCLWDTPSIWANDITMCVYSCFVFINIPSNILFLFPWTPEKGAWGSTATVAL